jgi:hypothetical protein
MNKQQTAAALQLVALLEGDLEAQANCTVYGNWFEHLTDHLADEHVEQLTLSCKQLHPCLLTQSSPMGSPEHSRG